MYVDVNKILGDYILSQMQLKSDSEKYIPSDSLSCVFTMHVVSWP